MTRNTARIILINALVILGLIAALKTFAQPNGNFNSVRVKAGNDTASFSPQPNGTILYGNSGKLLFKTATYWKELAQVKPGVYPYWGATGATTITTPTLTGSFTLVGNQTLTGNLTGTGNITRTGNIALTGDLTGTGNITRTGDLTLTGTTILTGYASVQSGQTTLAAGTVNYTPLQIVAGTLKTSPISGGVEYDGTYFYGTTSTGRYIMPSVLTGSYSINFANTAAGAYDESAAQTLTGVTATGWVCSCSQNTTAGIGRSAFYAVEATGADQIKLRYNNNYTAATDPGAATFYVICIKK